MKKTAYGKPLVVNGEKTVALEKMQQFNEATIQNLIFENPECLPISDIDESYNPMIPVCMELNTPAGPLDILMVTPNGELTIIETKLWSNPEARRVVVAQILDYAKELSRWSYEDLQRELNRKLNRKGNTLYEIAKSTDSHLLPPESDFVDSVSRNLARGRFLLLIVGDGIREGAIGITEFLAGAGHLNFSFAMVELSLFQNEQIGTLIIPKTIVKTVEIPKFTVEIPNGLSLTQSDDFSESNGSSVNQVSPEKEKERRFYEEFWKEFVEELELDDPGQAYPKPRSAQNLYLYPASSKKAWISAYFAKSSSEVGVYFRTQNDQGGHEIASDLSEFSEAIKAELTGNYDWWNWDEFVSCGVKMPCQDIFDPANRQKLIEFFSTKLNLYVNVFRPKIKSIGH